MKPTKKVSLKVHTTVRAGAVASDTSNLQQEGTALQQEGTALQQIIKSP